MSLQAIFDNTIPTYQKSEDQDFPVSKLRLFMDVLWQHLTGKQLDETQRTQLKQLIDLLNLLDEHKHESTKELIASMMTSVNPLLNLMPSLGYTATVTFTHLVPMYQHYLPTIELMVKDAKSFSIEDTLLYYEATIFDHLFLVHLFENESQINLIELIVAIKTIILINAMIYDYHQHTKGRSISFFTFLERGGKTSAELLPFLNQLIGKLIDEAKGVISTPACLETLEFLKDKLLATTNEIATPIPTVAEIGSVVPTTIAPSTQPIPTMPQATIVEPVETPIYTATTPASSPPPTAG